MKRGLAAAIILSSFIGSSCYSQRAKSKLPHLNPNYTISKTDSFVYFDFPNSERYSVLRSLFDVVESRLREKDRKIISDSDLLVRIAPVLDMDGDKSIDFLDAVRIGLSKEKYNTAVDIVNSYYPEDSPRFSRR